MATGKPPFAEVCCSQLNIILVPFSVANYESYCFWMQRGQRNREGIVAGWEIWQKEERI